MFPSENIWPHLIEHSLPLYLGNTLTLMALVMAGAAIIGTGCAWMVVMTEFPGRRVLEWALLAPMAIPSYIGAYALVDFLEYAGPVQTGLRALFGWQDARDYWFPQIRSMEAGAFVMAFVLYPYVYLLARAAFREQSVCALEVGRALGCGPWGVFFRVGLPLARPGIVAGTALVAMETLNDFGTVDFYNIQTLTKGVFLIWLDTYNAGGAAQIAVVMLGFVFLLILLERLGRRGQKFHQTSKRYRPIRREENRGVTGWLITLLCFLPVLIGFIGPVLIISSHSIRHFGQWLSPQFWQAVLNTTTVSGAAALIACGIGVLTVYGARTSGAKSMRWLAQLTALGYAVPGAVLSVGVLIPLAGFDNWLADQSEALLGIDPGLLLTGSIGAIIYAYVVRFSAIAHGAVDGAFGRVTPSIELAARTLGETKSGTLGRVHLPMIKGSILTACLLIFVDSVKELPATLMLRPFNFETLATTVYGHASLERLAESGPASIAIVLISLAPVILMMRTLDRSRPGEGRQ
ncbi:iron ABC transporter permease [Rhodobacteraceae bacterium NNCM2]|nr:iron ABC transporter permease [Coraliihabitans acroporae]